MELNIKNKKQIKNSAVFTSSYLIIILLSHYLSHHIHLINSSNFHRRRRRSVLRLYDNTTGGLGVDSPALAYDRSSVTLVEDRLGHVNNTTTPEGDNDRTDDV